MSVFRIGLVGDHDAEVTAHKAIESSLEMAAVRSSMPMEWTWLATGSLAEKPEERLDRFSGLWCVPASPYANTEGALRAIRHARTRGLPFLGTCGGFQHALLEYARNVWGLPAEHAEQNTEAVDPLIARLSCSLVETTARVRFMAGSRLHAIYGGLETEETYRCRFGLNPKYASRLDEGPLRASGRDEAGEVRAIELHGHPFFIATLYQPERAGLTGRLHPVVRAFLAAAVSHRPPPATRRSAAAASSKAPA